MGHVVPAHHSAAQFMSQALTFTLIGVGFLVAASAILLLTQLVQRLRLVRDLQALTADMKFAEHVAGIGYWSWSEGTGNSVWSDGMYVVYGQDPKTFVPSYDNIAPWILPQYLPAVNALSSYENPEQRGGGVEAQIRCPDGRIKDVLVAIRHRQNKSGKFTGLFGVVADITARKDAERAIAEREEQLQRAVSPMGAAIWDCNLISDRLFTGSRFAEILGLDPQTFSLTTARHRQLCHPEDLLRLREAFSNHVKTGADFDVEYRMMHAAGHYVWIHCRGRVVSYIDQRPERLIGTIVEVTERRNAEEELRRSRESLELAMGASQAGYFDVDVESGAAYWSPRACEILGLTSDRFNPSPATLPQLLHPDDVQEFMAHYAEFIARLTPLDAEVRARHNAGHYVWVHLRVVPRLDGHGRYVRTIGFLHDISSRKQAQQAVADSERKFRNLIEGSLQGVVILRKDKAMFCNLAYAHMLGYDSVDEVMALDSLMIHVPADAQEEARRRWDLALRRELEGKALKRRMLDRSGRSRWFESMERIIEWEGHAARQLVVLDVTERVAREAELSAARDRLINQADELTVLAQNLEMERERAEAANAAKSQFLAMMSHELRTPMTGVMGIADLLMMSKLTQEQEGLTKLLRRSARVLLDLLNDILDFSKIEAGQLEVESITFNISEIISDVTNLFAPVASEKGILLEAKTPQTYWDVVKGDPKRLRQVLSNLVGNAVKFTRKGRITIVLEQLVDDADGVTLQFSVIDTGMGIAENEISKLFQPFVQAAVSTSRKYGGTGLGLAISRRLVEGMGGTIGVASEIGIGSTFTFTVKSAIDRAVLQREVAPVQRPAFKPAKAAAVSQTILLAEDNETSRYLISTMLSRMGHTIDAVEDGAQAVSAAATKRYDVILMDMQMPVMDGPEATRAIRKSGALNAGVPIIALTADIIAEHRNAYFAAGVNSIVGKPVNWDELSEEMKRQIGQVSEASPAREAVMPEPPKGEMTKEAGSAEEIDAAVVLDEAALVTLADALGEGVLAPMLDTFQANMIKYRDDLSAAVDADDLKKAKRTGHALKGLCAQFGAIRVSDFGNFIEMDAASVADVRSVLPKLAENVEATKKALARRSARVK